MRNSGNIDIHMIPSEEGAQPRRESLEERLARTPWQEFGIALGIAAVVTGFSLSGRLTSSATGRSRSSICSQS